MSARMNVHTYISKMEISPLFLTVPYPPPLSFEIFFIICVKKVCNIWLFFVNCTTFFAPAFNPTFLAELYFWMRRSFPGLLLTVFSSSYFLVRISISPTVSHILLVSWLFVLFSYSWVCFVFFHLCPHSFRDNVPQSSSIGNFDPWVASLDSQLPIDAEVATPSGATPPGASAQLRFCGPLWRRRGGGR